MSKHEQLDHLLEMARQAPEVDAPAIRPGFAARVAKESVGRSSMSAEESVQSAFRWAVVVFAVVTILVAAVNAPSLAVARFTHDAAYESHLLDIVLLRKN